ncbi:MAG: CrcB family protein [Brevundimonas sp.]
MTARPHLNPALVAIVALGGAAGSAARYGVSHALPAQHGFPVGTFVENLVGAFLLGVLLEALARAGAENRTRRALRLGLGTGVLGGFTTYSALALEVERLWSAGDVGMAMGYGLASVVLGTATATLGIVVGARAGRRAGTGGGES